MAISANTVLEVRLTGSDTNGGGFVTGASGTDWSQQDSAQYSVTDGVTAGSTTITSATASFGTDVVGNIMYVQGGTGSVTAGWYQITARTNSTTITVDRSTGLTAGTGVTLKIGGALASPGQGSAILNANAQDGLIMYIKYNASPYVVTSASTNVSGGCCAPPNNRVYIVGYDTTRARYAPFQNRPTIQLNSGVSSATIFANLNAQYSLQSVILDANAQTSSTCFQSSGEAFFVKAMNYTTAGIRQNTFSLIQTLCEVVGGGAGASHNINAAIVISCSSHGNAAAPGIFVTGAAFNCLSYGNTGDGFGMQPGGGVTSIVNCTSYGNTGRGFYLGNTAPSILTVINSIAEGNGSYGYMVNTGMGQLINCADYNNTSGRKNTASFWAADLSPVNGSGSFFNNAAGGDFGLNATSGAGAAVRASSFPGSSGFPGLSSTIPYLDIGAVQHQDAGGSFGPIAQLKQFNRGTPY